MIAVITASSGGKLPSETFAVLPISPWIDQQPDAVEQPAEEAAVGSAPPVAMLEACDEPADGGQDRDDPVGEWRDADQHAL